MAYEKRKYSTGEYYYVGTRVGRKVVKTYLGRRGDPAAELARLLLAEARREAPRPRSR